MADKLVASEGFRDVDAAPDPLRFVRSMQSSSESAFMRARARDRLGRSGLPPRGIVLDLGCGLGADTLMLARHVAPGGGRAIGLDRSETMLSEARARPEAADLPVEFRQGDVHRLPFADGELDGCWVERVLIHAEAPAVAMSEMRRVLHEGGRAVIMEPDYRTLAIDASDRGVSEFVAATFAAKHRNPDAGGALLRLALDAGFAKAEVEPEAARFPSF
jgi:ubiquinone/menaquinone biosynthesis C-methylase UbiE